MFDPTAFDNMKVVIEGAIYDLDFSGGIKIIDRNDYLNTAKMSRIFNMTFQLNKASELSSSVKFEMEAGLINLASELIPDVIDHLSGCHITLVFELERPNEFKNYQGIDAIFKEVWGTSRKVIQSVRFNPIKQEKLTIFITVDFERMIGEEQMDDLVAMIDSMVHTLEKLDQL